MELKEWREKSRVEREFDEEKSVDNEVSFFGFSFSFFIIYSFFLFSLSSISFDGSMEILSFL